MRKKVLFTFLIFLFLFSISLLSLNPIKAQTSGTCSKTGTAVVENGLVSTPNLGDDLVNSSGVCIIDPKAAFAPYKVPTYDDLKSLYYTQAKTTNITFTKHLAIPPTGTGDANEDSIDLRGTTNHLYFINGNLTKRAASDFLQNTIEAEKRVAVVFVQENLTIDSDIVYTGGLVFIVKGDVNIASDVDTINAVIIAEGTICTAFDGTSCLNGTTITPQLTLNGSLISLNSNKPIQFRRSLDDNSEPSEKINHDVKYLVLLRNLMSDTFQRWSEIP